MAQYCFVYSKDKDNFDEINKQEVVEQYFTYLSNEPEKLESFAEENGSNAVLLFNETNSQWILVYAKGTGIVTQRIVRRRADSVSRTGILLSTGERIGAKIPLQVVSDSNIGDLNKSVQKKFLRNSNLTGV
jgi:hypothetical protein